MNEVPRSCQKEISDGSSKVGHAREIVHTGTGTKELYKPSEATCYAACHQGCFPRKSFSEHNGPGGDPDVAMGMAHSKALAYINANCKLRIYQREQAAAIKDAKEERAKIRKERKEKK